MRIKIHVWRQSNRDDRGEMKSYDLDGLSPDMSFLEMMDQLNEKLIDDNEEPVAFDHDCREGVCGMCSMVINGEAHGPKAETTTCQLYMRHFDDGAEIFVEPWRARSFPVVRDLVVDRSAFDRIIQAGGFISNHSGPKPEPNSIPIEPGVSKDWFISSAPPGKRKLLQNSLRRAGICSRPSLSDSLVRAMPQCSHISLPSSRWIDCAERSPLIFSSVSIRSRTSVSTFSNAW